MWRYYWILPFLERILGTGRYTNNLSGTDPQTTRIQTAAWLDYIIFVTNVTVEKFETEVEGTIKKLEEAGYGLHPKKGEFFKRKATHRIDQNGIKPLQNK